MRKEFEAYLFDYLFIDQVEIGQYSRFPSDSLQYHLGPMELSLWDGKRECFTGGYHRIECPLLIRHGREFSNQEKIIWKPRGEDWGYFDWTCVICQNGKRAWSQNVGQRLYLAATSRLEFVPGDITWGIVR
jgi:hypothetical protein